MKTEIIKNAILSPNSFPWRDQFKKKNLEISNEEINEVLLEVNLSKPEKRRRIFWELERIVYKAVCEAEDLRDLKVKIVQYIKRSNNIDIYVDEDVISIVLFRKAINSDEKIKFYQDFIKGKIDKVHYSSRAGIIIPWLAELFAYSQSSCDGNTIKNKQDLISFLEDKIKPVFYDDNYKKDIIAATVRKLGFTTEEYINLFNSTYKGAHEEFEAYISSFLNYSDLKKEEKKASEGFDLNAELFELIEGAVNSSEAGHDLTVNKAEPLVKLELKTEVKSEETSLAKSMKENSEDKDASETKNLDVIQNIKENLANMAEVLDYVLVSKEDYKKLKENAAGTGRNIIGEAGLLKKLVSPNEGAVLSELYNLFMKVDETDRSNIKAVLTDFFNTLMLLGVEVDVSMGKLGEGVEVNSKNVLTDFILSSPLDKDGSIKGIIKYNRWVYNGQTLIPAVIQPKK